MTLAIAPSRSYAQLRRDTARAAGKCQTCCKRRAVTGRSRCASCLRNHRKRNNTMYAIANGYEPRWQFQRAPERHVGDRWSAAHMVVTFWADASQMPCFVEQRTRRAA